MSGFRVLKAGIISQIQDIGRFSYTNFGITNSGVSDEYSYMIANLLLDNKKDTNILELCFAGLILEALEDTIICITGADFGFTLNENEFKPWQSLKVKKGDILNFTKKLKGEKAYLSVKGGFLLEKELGSFSTTIKESFGTVLKNDMILPYSKNRSKVIKRLKKIHQPAYEETLVLRVVLGYQYKYFSKQMQRIFFNSEFILTNEVNRMGAKVEGKKIECEIDGIISEPITFGAIQIPKDGNPIILLKERQTIGGYPKIGSALSIDCFKLSQVKIGTKIRFKEISLIEAQDKVKHFMSIENVNF